VGRVKGGLQSRGQEGGEATINDAIAALPTPLAPGVQLTVRQLQHCPPTCTRGPTRGQAYGYSLQHVPCDFRSLSVLDAHAFVALRQGYASRAMLA
jgi:hypothetical protein